MRKKTAAIREFQCHLVRIVFCNCWKYLSRLVFEQFISPGRRGSGYSRHPQLSPDNTASIHHSQTVSTLAIYLEPQFLGFPQRHCSWRSPEPLNESLLEMPVRRRSFPDNQTDRHFGCAARVESTLNGAIEPYL